MNHYPAIEGLRGWRNAVAKTRREQITEFLRSRGEPGATNAEIVGFTGIGRTKVFQHTQAMLARGDVRARRDGVIWHFTWADGSSGSGGQKPPPASGPLQRKNANA